MSDVLPLPYLILGWCSVFAVWPARLASGGRDRRQILLKFLIHQRPALLVYLRDFGDELLHVCDRASAPVKSEATRQLMSSAASKTDSSMGPMEV